MTRLQCLQSLPVEFRIETILIHHHHLRFLVVDSDRAELLLQVLDLLVVAFLRSDRCKELDLPELLLRSQSVDLLIQEPEALNGELQELFDVVCGVEVQDAGKQKTEIYLLQLPAGAFPSASLPSTSTFSPLACRAKS